IGTRAATSAPLPELGLIALLDDGDDQWSEPHAPYPHSREISCLRVGIDGCALLIASPARTPEIQNYIDSGWLGELSLSAGQRRQHCPVVRAVAATHNRLPHEVFVTLRAGLASGPVLVQIPRTGHYLGLLCRSCRERVACPRCGTTVIEALPGTLSCRSCGWTGSRGSWRCRSCTGNEIRAAVVGATRQVDELKVAFPGVPVVLSAAGTICPDVGVEPCLVVATPGAEPPAVAGYAAAVLLDADALLSRPDLRAAEEALRRWSTAVSLVRGPAQGGSVIIVGDPISRAIQALVRHDPVGFAQREIEEREGALLPPQAALIAVEGSPAALSALLATLTLPQGAEAFGPLPCRGSDEQRLLLKMAPAQRRGVTNALRTIVADWSQHKDPYLVRIRVDPIAV
ncbi:MAG: primosomal protein N', partial [Propionibacteriaceae bacterium]